MAPPDHDQIKRIVVQTLDSPELGEKISGAVEKGMDKWGIALGLNVLEPLKQQADLAHLNKWRRIVESTTTKIVMGAVTAAASAWVSWVGAHLWAGNGAAQEPPAIHAETPRPH